MEALSRDARRLSRIRKSRARDGEDMWIEYVHAWRRFPDSRKLNTPGILNNGKWSESARLMLVDGVQKNDGVQKRKNF